MNAFDRAKAVGIQVVSVSSHDGVRVDAMSLDRAVVRLERAEDLAKAAEFVHEHNSDMPHTMGMGALHDALAAFRVAAGVATPPDASTPNGTEQTE